MALSWERTKHCYVHVTWPRPHSTAAELEITVHTVSFIHIRAGTRNQKFTLHDLMLQKLSFKTLLTFFVLYMYFPCLCSPPVCRRHLSCPPTITRTLQNCRQNPFPPRPSLQGLHPLVRIAFINYPAIVAFPSNGERRAKMMGRIIQLLPM